MSRQQIRRTFLPKIGFEQVLPPEIEEGAEPERSLVTAKHDAYQELNRFIQYLRPREQYQVLTKQQEQDLFRKLSGCKVGSADWERLREQIVKHNIRLLIQIALRYRYPGVSTLDLIDVGFFGLNKAVERFSYERNLKFSTYATWWIRQAITHSLYDRHLIRIPKHLGERFSRVARRIDSLEAEGKQFSDVQVSRDVNLSLEQIKTVQAARRLADLIELDRENKVGAGTLLDILPSSKRQNPELIALAEGKKLELQRQVSGKRVQLAKKMSFSEQKIFWSRYRVTKRYEVYGIKEVSQRLGVDYVYASNVIRKGLKILRVKHSDLAGIIERLAQIDEFLCAHIG